MISPAARPRQRGLAALGLTLCVLLPDAIARAAPPPAALLQVDRVRALKAATSLGFSPVPEAEAEGRPIRAIHVHRDAVFVPDEPWPLFLNALHARTTEATVRRELLFAEGDRWQATRAAETVRNLRGIGTYALVAIVPVVATGGASSPGDTVDALVYTRDLWSLRLESSFSLNQGVIDRLSLSLLERNLLGRNQLVGGLFELLPATASAGAIFHDRRLFGSRWQVAQSTELIFGRASGELEGTRGGLSLGRPLYDLRVRHGFELDVAWNDSVGRQLQGLSLLTWDDPTTSEAEAIPRVWDRSLAQAALTGATQLGRRQVHRLRYGLGLASSRFAPHATTGLASAPASDPARAAFEADVLPISRREVYPFVGWEVFDPTWVVFTDLGAYGLAEEVRTGPWSAASVATPLAALGSRADALVWSVAAGLVLAPATDEAADGNLLSAADRALIDLEASASGRLEAQALIDARYRARLRAATPRFFGRLALLAELDIRHRDTASTLVTLGGDSGLRGFPSQALFGFGADRLRASLEWRSPPWVIGSIHMGATLFYDAGALGDAPRAMTWGQAAGAGLRVLFPQFNRFVFRVDLGVPLRDGPPEVLLSVGSSQLLPLTTLEDRKLAP
jgi:hypothetical protein